MSQPANPHPGPDYEPPGAGAQGCDRADDLMARNDRITNVRQLAVQHVQIGAADAAGRNADQNLPRSRLGHVAIAHFQRLAAALENHRTHGKLLRWRTGRLTG